jgi:hypothetical protein
MVHARKGRPCTARPHATSMSRPFPPSTHCTPRPPHTHPPALSTHALRASTALVLGAVGLVCRLRRRRRRMPVLLPAATADTRLGGCVSGGAAQRCRSAHARAQDELLAGRLLAAGHLRGRGYAHRRSNDAPSAHSHLTSPRPHVPLTATSSRLDHTFRSQPLLISPRDRSVCRG